MIVTKKWLNACKTEAGGYTKEQIKSLGMEWPPVIGWQDRIIGMDIHQERANEFARLSGNDFLISGTIAKPGTVKIWTDGSCHPNPGRGGWGWHRCDGEESFGGENNTTNNRMEMTAILKSLIELPRGQEVLIYSDSQYCIKGLTEWRKGWKRKNWIKKGEPMINRDLWIDLDKHVERLSITFEWVRGHNGNAGNEHADYLAGLGMSSCQSL